MEELVKKFFSLSEEDREKFRAATRTKQCQVCGHIGEQDAWVGPCCSVYCKAEYNSNMELEQNM